MRGGTISRIREWRGGLTSFGSDQLSWVSRSLKVFFLDLQESAFFNRKDARGSPGMMGVLMLVGIPS